MASPFLQGKYQLDFPNKYNGDMNDVVFRSSWELIAFKFCDNNPDIIAWSSESVIIPYRGVDGLMHRYFMDLWIACLQPDGTPKKFLVEIKPKYKLNPPKKTPRKKDQTFLRELNEYLTNQKKWEAAREWCRVNNMTFLIWTEDVLLPTNGKFPSASARQKQRANRRTP